MIDNSSLYEYPPPDRIIVIGDLHGDIKRLKDILVNASIINNHLEWIANPPKTFVVQVGDQLDSMNRNKDAGNWEKLNDICLLQFTNSLDLIARAKGGRFISLIGNHELMNVMGNFSYVSPQSMISDRRGMFRPKGSLSTLLSSRPLVLKIGNLFFCHAGITKNHLEILDKHNKPISYLNDIWKRFMLHNEVYDTDKDIFDNIITHPENGILWTRNFGSEDDISYVTNRLQCQFVFVGHTTVSNISLMHNKIWLTDNCISRAFNSNSYEYIDIVNKELSIRSMSDEKNIKSDIIEPVST
jgi:hypothetical protein